MSSLPLQLKSPAKFVKTKPPAMSRANSPEGASASSTSMCRSPARDRGHHQHAISVAKLILIAAEEADVFLVDVDVYEAPHLARVVAQMLDDCRKPLLDFTKQFRQIRRVAFDHLDTVCKPAQR